MKELSSKKKHFIRVFKQEFHRELAFLWDVMGGRSAARADFTDGMMELVKQGMAITAELCPIPGSFFVEMSLGLALDYWNGKRNETTRETQLEQALALDEAALDIILDTVALEIVCRYEYWIDERLEDGALSVVPLAQAAIARMLAHLASRQLPITEANLLQGLMAGSSGAKVSGYFNTELPVKLEDKSVKLRLTRRSGYTAEGLFARCGFLTPDKKLWVLSAKESVQQLAHAKSKSSSSVNYGYTNIPKKGEDPKYLAYVSPAEKNRWYGHVEALEPYSSSKSLQAKLNIHKTQQQLVRIDRADLEDFVRQEIPNQGLLEYVRLLGFSKVILVLFAPTKKEDCDLSDLNLEGLDLSHCVFNHCHFGRSLKGTRFNSSYLRGANFSKVDTAGEADFKEAYLEHLMAPGIDFSKANFSQANLSYADLTKANLKHAIMLGTLWANTQITGVVTDQGAQLLAEQAKQIDALKAIQSTMKSQMEQTDPRIEECREALSALQAKLGEDHRLVVLQRDLLQEQQQRAAFERWNRQEILELKRTATRDSLATQQVLQEQQVLMVKQEEELKAFRLKLENLSQKVLSKNIGALDAEVEDLDVYFDTLVISHHKNLADLQKRVDDLEDKMQQVEQRVDSHAEHLAQHEAILAGLVNTKKFSEDQILYQAEKFLRDAYLAKQEIHSLFGKPLKLEGQYINVQMLYQVKEEQIKKDEKEKEENVEETKTFHDSRMSSHEDLFGLKMPVELNQLFLPAKTFLKENQQTLEKDVDQPPRLLLIQGRAGIGKSTFVDYAAREWAAGRLWPEYPWVFVLRLRDLRDPRFVTAAEEGKTYALSEWVYQAVYAGKIEEADFKLLWDKSIAPQLDKCLFILDGFDELPETHPCQSALEYLLTNKIPAIPKVITSRPYGLDAVPSDRRELEIVGFVDQNVDQYVRFYYGEDRQEQATLILSALRENTALWGNAHIPVTLNILCGVLEEKLKTEKGLVAELKNLGSMSGLYQRMEGALFERAYRSEVPKAKSILQHLSLAEKEELIFEHYKSERDILSRLAFKGFHAQQLVLSPALLSKVLGEANIAIKQRSGLIQSMLSLGLLKPVLGENADDQIGYEFLHLTFQEYGAALWIIAILKANNPEEIKILNQLKNDPRYQIVWWFVSGVLKTDKETWLRLMVFLQDPLTQDLIGHYHLALLVHCTEEAWGLAQSTGVLVPIREAVQQCLAGLFELNRNGLLPYYFNSPLLVALRISPQWLHAKTSQEDVFAKLLGSLLNLLDDDLWGAHRIIGVLGAAMATPIILQRLADLLCDESCDIRWRAANAIEALGAAAATPIILQRLADVLCDENWCVRKSAADAIEALGAAAATLIFLERLADMLRDDNEDVRKSAARAIGVLGAAAATPIFLERLADMLRDDNEDVRKSAARAIRVLGAAAATPIILERLADLLCDESRDVRESAADAIKALGVAAATPIILQHLADLLYDESRDVRESADKAIKALVAVGMTSEFLVHLIRVLLRAPNKMNMIKTLQKIGIEFLTILQLQYIVHPIVFIVAYLAGNVQLSVQWHEEIEQYKLMGFYDKSPIDIPLSLQEAQMLRHMMPKVIDCIHQLDFEGIKVLLENPSLPAIDQDPLLPEYKATLSLDIKEDLNITRNSSAAFEDAAVLKASSITSFSAASPAAFFAVNGAVDQASLVQLSREDKVRLGKK